MSHRIYIASCTIVLVMLLACPLPAAEGKPKTDSPQGKDTPAKTSQAWTFQSAMEQLSLNPEDVYLQYVVLQLGRNENQLHEAAELVGRLSRRNLRSDRDVDLFDLFTGALAVQESLQLDAMRGEAPRRRMRPVEEEFQMDENGVLRPKPVNKPDKAAQGNAETSVKLADLKGSKVKSHPWGTMLAMQNLGGKKHEVSALSMCVPEDQYFVEFHSMTKMLQIMDAGNLWGSHLFSQAAKDAKSFRTDERLRTQLAVQTDLLTRPFYDLVVDSVAITGSDVFFNEGTDVTMLFALKQPEVFRSRMDGYITAAEKAYTDAKRTTGKISGVEYVQVSTPDRAVNVFSAYPRPDLHVRSNSETAMKRVLSAIAKEKGVALLGESAEFKYIRTLMVQGDPLEDCFVYLSDPMIRRLIGPQTKLTERRRMICYNGLRMIGHAAMLYRTQFGKQPESLAQLVDAGCAPKEIAANAADRSGSTPFLCPCGGKYSLSADGTLGVCSIHGRCGELVPCCDLPLENITQSEAQEYRMFVEDYNRYWQRYFDPIAIRIQANSKQYRAETLILPLIDNSVYTGLSSVLGGTPEPLDALAVPKRNIFSVAARVNKEQLLKNANFVWDMVNDLEREKVVHNLTAGSIEEFLQKGLGNQISLNVCDASPMFDLNMPELMGEMVGQFRGLENGRIGGELLPVSFLVASLNSPVYLAIPVKDKQVVDKFIDGLDETLSELARRPSEGGMFPVDFDFYKMPLGETKDQVRCAAMVVGPAKLRMFYARLGDCLYIASKAFILDDLAALKGKTNENPGPTAHGMVRVRPDNWNEALPEFKLGWAEGGRAACLKNLGPLSSVARAMKASTKGEATAAEVSRQADQMHAVHFYCPDGGKYELSPDGTRVVCSLHGTPSEPRQLSSISPKSPLGRILNDFGGATAELTFLEDGLHAVVTIERK